MPGTFYGKEHPTDMASGALTMAQSIQAIPAVDEGELIARAGRKEEAAVRTIIQRYNRRLFRIARSIVRDDSEAEDVVQEAYVRAFSKLAEFRGESSLCTWLSRIVMNEALGRLRRQSSAPIRISLESLEPGGKVIPFPLASKQPDPEQTMAQNEIRLILERTIDDLPERYRIVLMARVIEGMSVAETAELLGLRPQTVKTRLHRAKRFLRTSLEEQIGPALSDTFPFDGMRCQRMADLVVRRLSALT
jgi:RNA polymerase sigma-70 factor, ECF subfamily